MFLFVEVMAVVLPLLTWMLVADYFMNDYAKTLDLDKVNRKFESFQAKVPVLGPGSGKTKYIVTGGAGFVGAWIARFLLLRNDSDILLLDNNPTAPGDLIKHGVKHIVCELTDKEEVQKIIKNLKIEPNSSVVVFHAAAIQRYFLSWLSFHVNISNKNVEIVQILIDVFTDLSKSKSIPIYVVNIGDAISRRRPISWWMFWGYKSWAKQAVDQSTPKAFISSYAQSKAESESLFLEANDGKTLITGSIEPHGIICGYYGEPLLSPCLYYNGALNHCWEIPTSFLHIEDVARAALLLEIKLRNKATTTKVQGKSFLVSNGQLMRMKDVFAQIKESLKDMRVIKVNPALVLVISYATQLLSLVTVSGRNGWKKRDDSLFSGRWWSLTPVRFTTLQLCQIPDAKRMQETKDLLDFEPARTTRDTIQSTVEDYVRIDSHMAAMKKARKEEEEAARAKKIAKELAPKFGVSEEELQKQIKEKGIL